MVLLILVMLRFSKIQCCFRGILAMIALALIVSNTFAQHPISNALYRLLATGDYQEANEAINNYAVNELATLPDSILFDYYYLKAAIMGNDGDETNKRAYLLEAKKLCEKSQGIHSPVYLEICWAIGKSFEEIGDIVAAFEIYQAALIQSIGLYSLDDDVKWQYEEINNKVISWYKDSTTRRLMINHRENILPRPLSNDVIQNDMEFYVQYYKDEHLKSLIAKADSLNTFSSWDDAAKLYIEVANKTHNNPIAKATLQELAAMNYMNLENLQLAEELLLNNIRILESNKESKVYRRTLSQLSNLYNAIHNYSKAKEYASEAKFRYEEALDFSRGYILCLHRCATLERGNNNYFLALLLEDVALQELYKNKSFDIKSGKATSQEQFHSNLLSSAALHYNQVGFRDEAYLNIETAIRIAESNGLDASTYYSNYADLCIASRDFDKAVYASEKAYHLSDSENNKIQIGTILCLSQFLARQSISNKVLDECSQYLHSLINQTFAFTSMDERQNFWSYFEYYFPLLNFLAYQADNKNLNGQIYNNILVEKGLLLRTANSIRNKILEIGDPEDIQIYDYLLQLRALQSSLTTTESETIKAEIENLDKHLTRKFASYANFSKSNGITWTDVQRHLNDEDIAIEFYNIPEVDWHEDGKDVDGKYRYCAVTIRNDYDIPHIIPLFTDDRLQCIEQEDFYVTDSIYNLIWQPLAEELKGVKNIYFSADRELHKIGIEYAQIDSENRINNIYNIYRLSSTRILAEPRENAILRNTVLYGGLLYDLDSEQLIAESRNGEFHTENAHRAVDLSNLRYGVKYLPGTKKEVEDIYRQFKVSTNVTCDTIIGIGGTEESFKALANKNVGIIHLATHGFYWSEDDAEERSYVSFLANMNNNMQNFEDKALLRSGLFFSGANIGLAGEELPNDVEDGVLTAKELSAINLGSVDMVVMSACQSGLGETSGEGVFGLQRGFKLAGANTLLMSLWKVDDEATKILMTEFYKNYLSGKTKRESLQLAQQTLRQTHPEPEYWAGFILLDGLN